jgi:hypothetical protein
LLGDVIDWTGLALAGQENGLSNDLSKRTAQQSSPVEMGLQSAEENMGDLVFMEEGDQA